MPPFVELISSSISKKNCLTDLSAGWRISHSRLHVWFRLTGPQTRSTDRVLLGRAGSSERLLLDIGIYCRTQLYVTCSSEKLRKLSFVNYSCNFSCTSVSRWAVRKCRWLHPLPRICHTQLICTLESRPRYTNDEVWFLFHLELFYYLKYLFEFYLKHSVIHIMLLASRTVWWDHIQYSPLIHELQQRNTLRVERSNRDTAHKRLLKLSIGPQPQEVNDWFRCSAY